MHPVLIELGPITLYSYGFFMAAAFLLGMTWTMREAGLKGLDDRYVLDIGFYILLGGILGGRLLFAAINPDLFRDDLLGLFKLWKGGLIFMGGAIVASLFMVIYLRVKNQKILPWLDATVPGFALGLCVGWLGCLAAGCGYGKPADLLWSVTYSHPDTIGPLFTPLHPVQAYQALAAFACFVLVLSIKNRFIANGRLAGFFLIMYSLLRMLIDSFRGDIQADIAFLNMNHVLGLAVVAAGLALFFLPTGDKK